MWRCCSGEAEASGCRRHLLSSLPVRQPTHMTVCQTPPMSTNALLRLLQCSVAAPEDSGAASEHSWPPPEEHWRHATHQLHSVTDGSEQPDVPDLRHLAENAFGSNDRTREAAASAWLEWAVACLRVFWQANVSGPPLDVPESPLRLQQSAPTRQAEVRIDCGCGNAVATLPQPTLQVALAVASAAQPRRAATNRTCESTFLSEHVACSCSNTQSRADSSSWVFSAPSTV